ncbi:hypothetical protein JTB14_032308 [Gonioctena quinquepunctata]|nr:hypothetical protein JTB14_032308 [Gonioctena quinquepunctata]
MLIQLSWILDAMFHPELRGMGGCIRGLFRSCGVYGCSYGVYSRAVVIPIPQLSHRDSTLSNELSSLSEGSDDIQNVTVPVTICLSMMVGYICGGALLFCKWEEHWSFKDASYFCLYH